MADHAASGPLPPAFAVLLLLPCGSKVGLKVGESRELGRKDHRTKSVFVSKIQCKVCAFGNFAKLTTLSKTNPTILLRGGKTIVVRHGQSQDLVHGDEIGLLSKTQDGLVLVTDPKLVAQRASTQDQNHLDERKPKEDERHASSAGEQKKAQGAQPSPSSSIRTPHTMFRFRWRSQGSSLIKLESVAGAAASKIAAFDFDGCLTHSKGGWMPRRKEDYLFPTQSVLEKVREVHREGYAVVIFTNQSTIRSAHQGKTAERVKWAIEETIKRLKVPVDVFMATQKDQYRKGLGVGMWTSFLSLMKRRGVSDIDLSNSFFVGDAAGRPTDHSDSDKKFAQAVNIKFFTPEEYFKEGVGGSDPRINILRKLAQDVRGQADKTKLFNRSLPGPIVAILCGPQGSGKSTFSLKITQSAPGAWVQVNQDTIRNGKRGTMEMCIVRAEKALSEGQSVLVDRMNLSPQQRSPYIALCSKLTARCHAIVFLPPASLAANRVLRRRNHSLSGPKGAFLSKQSHAKLVPPRYEEGFAMISICQDDAASDELGQYYSLVERAVPQKIAAPDGDEKGPVPTKRAGQDGNLPSSEAALPKKRKLESAATTSSKPSKREKGSKNIVTKKKRNESGSAEGVGETAEERERKRMVMIQEENDRQLALLLSQQDRQLEEAERSKMQRQRSQQLVLDEKLALALSQEEEEQGAVVVGNGGETRGNSSECSGFRLLKIHRKHNMNPGANDMSVNLREMVVADALVQPKWVIVTNYMLDFPWFLRQWPELLAVPKVLIFHGQKEDIDSKQLPTNFEAYAMIPEETHKIRYGVFHSKSFVLGFENEIRVVVHTANLIDGDFNSKSQGSWQRSFPLKSAGSRPSSLFEEDFVKYMDSFKVRWKRSEWTDLAQNTKETLSVETLKRFDYSNAGVRLIASVPGWHKGKAFAEFGHAKLRDVLGKEIFSKEFDGAPLVAQFSSLGSLNEKWIGKFCESLSAGADLHGKKIKLPKSGGFKIIWPTVDEVRTSLEGYVAGGSIPGHAKNVKKAFFRSLCHRWATDETHHRKRAAPHIKTYLRYSLDNPSKLAWFLLTSHNLSKAAWGEAQKGRYGPQFFIRHWELGVLFVPSSQKDTEFVTTGTKSQPQNKQLRFPLPYALPPLKYRPEDRPWMCDVRYDIADRYGRTSVFS